MYLAGVSGRVPGKKFIIANVNRTRTLGEYISTQRRVTSALALSVRLMPTIRYHTDTKLVQAQNGSTCCEKKHTYL